MIWNQWLLAVVIYGCWWLMHLYHYTGGLSVVVLWLLWLMHYIITQLPPACCCDLWMLVADAFVSFTWTIIKMDKVDHDFKNSGLIIGLHQIETG